MPVLPSAGTPGILALLAGAAGDHGAHDLVHVEQRLLGPQPFARRIVVVLEDDLAGKRGDAGNAIGRRLVAVIGGDRIGRSHIDDADLGDTQRQRPGHRENRR